MSENLCEWVQLRMTEYVRREPSVPSHEREKIKDHLDFCLECRKYEDTEIVIQRAMRGDRDS